MDDLPFTQKTDGRDHVRVVHQTQNIVIGGAGFLLCCHVLVQIRDGVALAGEAHGRERRTARRLGPHAGRMVHKIGVEALPPDLVRGKALCQLVYNGAHHLQMGQLLGSDIRQQARHTAPGHGVALGQIAHARAQLAVRAAVLGDDHLCRRRVRRFDPDRELQAFLIAPHRFRPPFPTARARTSSSRYTCRLRHRSLQAR